MHTEHPNTEHPIDMASLRNLLASAFIMCMLSYATGFSAILAGVHYGPRRTSQCQILKLSSRSPTDSAARRSTPRTLFWNMAQGQTTVDRVSEVDVDKTFDRVFHSESLNTRGLTVLVNPVMDAALVESAREMSEDRLAHLLSKVEARGCDPLEQQYRFREVAHRQRSRWDLQLQVPGQGDSNSVWMKLCNAAIAAVEPIIREAQGDAYTGMQPQMIGAVISRPGARVQRFHCDDTHEHFAAAKADPSYRIYNIFIPLVDLKEDGDGTEFWAAPQLLESIVHLLSGTREMKKLPNIKGGIQAPACRAGGVILYDYRTIHRGLANPEGGRERPVAYVTITTGGARDTYNFPEWTIENAEVDVLEKFPFFQDLQAHGGPPHPPLLCCDSKQYPAIKSFGEFKTKMKIIILPCITY